MYLPKFSVDVNKFVACSDLSNKSHLKVLESRPVENGPVSYAVSSPTAVHTGAQATSTPLPNHNYIAPSDAIHSGVKYTRTTTVTRQGSNGHNVTTVTRVVEGGPDRDTATRAAVTEGTLMDQKKIPLPGLGTTLKPVTKRRFDKSHRDCKHFVIFFFCLFSFWL